VSELSASDLAVTQAPQWKHPLRERLTAGKPVFALTLTTSNVEAAVLGASLGFDFLWVEMEHSPVTLETLRTIVLATRGLPASVLARVPVIELWTAKRVLDQGVTGVIFPFTSSAELAKRAAQACRYPPNGLRGSGAGLAAATWPQPGSYYDSADANIFVVVMIEEARAIEEIDAIASTPGIDVLFIGTSDLSFSLGLRGRQDEPQLDAAIAKIVSAARRHGKFLGRPAFDAGQIARFRAQGFQMFQCATELGLMARGARVLLDPLGIEGVSADKKVLY
jgi:2-keto-3-deoxy-L-rhamnonate aldolase RhmA